MINQRTQQVILQSLFFLIIFGFCLATMSPFWMPILMACIFAMGIDKTLEKIKLRFGYEIKINLFSFFFVAFLCVFLPLGIFVLRAVQSFQSVSEAGIENTPIFQSVTSLKQKIFALIADYANPEWGIEHQLEVIFKKVTTAGSETVLKSSTAWLAALPDLIVAYLIFLFCLYVMLKQQKMIRVFFLKLHAFKVSESDELIETIKDACYATLVSSIIIGLIQGSIVAFSALAFSAGDFWLVLVITFFLSFIPAIGAAPVAFALSLPLFFEGSYFSAIGLCVVGVVTGTIDNVLRPILVGGDQDVHPLLMFLASVGGIVVFGIPGLFIGPAATLIFLKSFPLLMNNFLEQK